MVDYGYYKFSLNMEKKNNENIWLSLIVKIWVFFKFLVYFGSSILLVYFVFGILFKIRLVNFAII